MITHAILMGTSFKLNRLSQSRFFYRKQLRYRNWETSERHTYTEYKATVWNCECSETFYVRGPTGNVDVLPLGVFSPPENEHAEIITYYESYEMHIYNAVLNHPGMEANGVTFEFLLMYQRDTHLAP